MNYHHWQSQKVQQVGIDDLVLLPKVSESSVVEMLKKRYTNNLIFTYIGPVLISINPFKSMPYFTDKEIEIYQAAAQYENPPHIYALADDMYRNMLIDCENHCVIISGESGAGKTVCAKYIMNYISRVSGGGQKVQHVKEIILGTNPLLEAFGNAKTVRNNNSSRFGKYCEMLFSKNGGEPHGGKISNFLLEKSRVIMRNQDERSFHIFYQLCKGSPPEVKEQLGITVPEYYNYLNCSGTNYKVDGIDDADDFKETLNAMQVVGLSEEVQLEVLKIVAAILHIGNIGFEEKNNFAQVSQDDFLQFPAYLLNLKAEQIRAKITSRQLESKWGANKECVDVFLNKEQAVYTRDAWAKAIYSRLFDFLVTSVNEALNVTKLENLLTIGVLDIYGFEIFQRNGFEQFCINFVNEKLQQIFIELTLKAEQEEYQQEGVAWTQVEFFNNKIVCDLIESRNPPGIFCILDDICAQIHGQSDGVDKNFLNKLNKTTSQHDHYQSAADGFLIHHYAGQVSYDIDGFCDKNRDVLFPDLIQLMQSSSNPFIQALFPESITSGAKSRPTTAAMKIRSQANALVDSLSRCTPHYIRCIKPNETKRALEWEESRVKHQVEYLGLKENIRVRRAGYAYRRPFDKFIHRYSILLEKNQRKQNIDPKKEVDIILKTVHMDQDQYQMGRTKIFIKNPESLFLLEEMRERKYDYYARKIQKALKMFTSRKRDQKLKEQASDLLYSRKERCRYSINRKFYGDYIGLDNEPGIRAIVGKRERIEFASKVTKYDRRFKTAQRDLVLTGKFLFLIGREKIKDGPQKNKIFEVIKRRIPIESIEKIGLSTRQDNFLVLYILNDYSSVFELLLKTEFLTKLSKIYTSLTRRDLKLNFSDCQEYTTKKDKWFGSGDRILRFSPGQLDFPVLKSSMKELNIFIKAGLPKDTRPGTTLKNETRETPDLLRNQNRRIAPIKTNENNPKMTTNAVKNLIRRISTTESESIGCKPPRMMILEPGLQPKKNSVVKKDNNLSMDQNGNNEAFLKTPAVGKSGEIRQSIQKNAISKKPVPGAGRPKPGPPPPRPNRPPAPKCKSLYDYDAQATDELTLGAGDLIEIVKEDPSGWWLGRLNGKQGLFPSNYVEKV